MAILIRDQIINYYEDVTNEALKNLKKGLPYDFSKIKNHSLLGKMNKSFYNLNPDRTKINRYVNDLNKMANIAQNDYNNILRKVNSIRNDDLLKQKILSDYANKGVTGFYAKNGARWSLETYSNMYTTHWNNEMVRANLLNGIKPNEKVEISSHNNSCPICIPYQGRILTQEEFALAQTNGLFHIRCKHYAVRVIERDTTIKLTNRNISDRMLSNIETENLYRLWSRRLLVSIINYEIEKCKAKLKEYLYQKILTDNLKEKEAKRQEKLINEENED